MILALAKILRLEEFRQAHDLGSHAGGVGDATESLLQILFRLRAARHLHQRHAKVFRGHAFPTSAINIAGRAVGYQLSARSTLSRYEHGEGVWFSAKTRASLGLPATSFLRRVITSCAGAERRTASIAPSASSDSERTRSIRNSRASSCRVREIAESRTERHHGSLAFAKPSRNAWNPSIECVPAIARAASPAESSAVARKRPIQGIARMPSICRTPL